jgi:hypothetical protein
MRGYCFRSPMGLCLGLLVLAGCAAQPGGTASQAPVPLQPGMARVWVLRQPSSPGGNIAASDPMVFVNGQPLAQSAQGAVFFHDFQPESTASRRSPTEPLPTSSTRSSLHPGWRPMFKSRRCPIGNWVLSGAPALPC